VFADNDREIRFPVRQRTRGFALKGAMRAFGINAEALAKLLAKWSDWEAKDTGAQLRKARTDC
jgi:hypothetical protein